MLSVQFGFFSLQLVGTGNNSRKKQPIYETKENRCLLFSHFKAICTQISLYIQLAFMCHKISAKIKERHNEVTVCKNWIGLYFLAFLFLLFIGRLCEPSTRVWLWSFKLSVWQDGSNFFVKVVLSTSEHSEENYDRNFGIWFIFTTGIPSEYKLICPFWPDSLCLIKVTDYFLYRRIFGVFLFCTSVIFFLW